MADKKEIAKDIATVVIGGPVVGSLTLALKKALKKHKEIKDKKEKAKLQKIINDLKSEIKLSKGGRGAAEDMPKKKADENIENERWYKAWRKMYEEGKITPASRTHIPPKQSRGPVGMTQQEMRRRTKGKFDMKKGGSVSKYSKGGGVRKSKYSL